MNNTIAKIFKGIAICSFIIGFIGGIFLGNSFRTIYHEFNITLMISVWIGCFLEGMTFLALSEIIELEQRNNNYLYEINAKISTIKNSKFDKIFTHNSNNETINSKIISDTSESINPNNSTHKWRCDNCGELISETPCPFCNK